METRWRVKEAMDTLLPYFTHDRSHAEFLRQKLKVDSIDDPKKGYTANLERIVIPTEDSLPPLAKNLIVGEEVAHYLHLNTNATLARTPSCAQCIRPVDHLLEYVGMYGSLIFLHSKGMSYQMGFDTDERHLLQPIACLRFGISGPDEIYSLARLTRFEQLLPQIGGLPQSFLDVVYGRAAHCLRR